MTATAVRARRLPARRSRPRILAPMAPAALLVLAAVTGPLLAAHPSTNPSPRPTPKPAGSRPGR